MKFRTIAVASAVMVLSGVVEAAAIAPEVALGLAKQAEDVVSGGVDIAQKIVAMGQNNVTFSRSISGSSTTGNFSVAAVPQGTNDWMQFTDSADTVSRSYELVIKDARLFPVGKIKFAVMGDPCVQYDNDGGEYLKDVKVRLSKMMVAEKHQMTVSFSLGSVGNNADKGKPPVARVVINMDVVFTHKNGKVETRQYSFVVRGGGSIYRVRPDVEYVNNKPVPRIDICKNPKLKRLEDRMQVPSYVNYLQALKTVDNILE